MFDSWRHRERHSEVVSWHPASACPAVRSPPGPAASASFSGPYLWTSRTGSRCAEVCSSSQTSLDNPGEYNKLCQCRKIT